MKSALACMILNIRGVTLSQEAFWSGLHAVNLIVLPGLAKQKLHMPAEQHIDAQFTECVQNPRESKYLGDIRSQTSMTSCSAHL